MTAFVRHFTLLEAQALLPAVRERCLGIRALVLEDKRLRDARSALPEDASLRAPADEELEALSARVCKEIDAVGALGVQLKGLQPILVDIPAMLDGQSVLLCWCEGEDVIEHFHTPEEGFAGRRPITRPQAFGRELMQ